MQRVEVSYPPLGLKSADRVVCCPLVAEKGSGAGVPLGRGLDPAFVGTVGELPLGTLWGRRDLPPPPPPVSVYEILD